MENNSQPGKRHLISFLVDHTSPEFFFKFIDEGHAPHVSKYILGEKNSDGTYSKSCISRNIVTTFPSSSADCHPMVLTGTYAGKNNILSGQYWDLLGKKANFIITDKAGINAIKKYNNKYLNPEVKTLFEYFDNSASFHAVNRGANFKFLKNSRILTTFLPLLISYSRQSEPGAISPLSRPDLNREMLSKYIIKLLNELNNGKPLFDATFIVFLLTDANAHKFGYDSAEYREAIQILDLVVKLLIEGGEDMDGNPGVGLKEQGYLDSIVWNIFTDHSGRPLIKDKMIMIDSLLKVEGGLYIIEGMDKKDFKKKALKDISKINAFSALASEDACYWFGTGSKDLTDFSRFHGEKLFRDLIPNFPFVKYKPKKLDFIDFLVSKEYIQFVIIPEDEEDYVKITDAFMKRRISMPIPRKYNITIISSEGKAKIQRKLIDNKIHYIYHILEGKDPLQYDKVKMPYGEPISARKSLELTIKHELPDVFNRVFAPFDSKHAPNCMITSAYEYHFWSQHTTFENELRNVQTHGGIFGVESIVPVTFAGPGFKNGFEIPFGRNVDVLPTLLKCLNKEYDPDKIDGEPLVEALEEN
jgi:predicted AlkP superfamily pyrophosphatase or phosphodiesterase